MNAREKKCRALDIINRGSAAWLRENRGLEMPQVAQALRASGESLGRDEVLRSSLRTLSLRLTPDTSPDQFGDDDAVLLEAIVHTTLRPAVLVQDGKPVAWPPEWAHLDAHKEAIEFAAARTGRVEIEGDPALDWVGTAFVVDEGLAATNRHVVEEFAYQDPQHGWRLREGRRVWIDFAEEIGGGVAREVPVESIWGVHDTFDIALLSMGAGCPSPFPRTGISPKANDEVVTIGYPAFDSRRNDAVAMQQIFRGIYNVKRLLPGLVIESPDAPWVLRHDCSTLGGNSGSPVVRPSTAEVVGIHFRGTYLHWNEAVNLAVG